MIFVMSKCFAMLQSFVDVSLLCFRLVKVNKRNESGAKAEMTQRNDDDAYQVNEITRVEVIFFLSLLSLGNPSAVVRPSAIVASDPESVERGFG